MTTLQRRELLQPRSLGQAIGSLPSVPQASLLSVSRRAMACLFEALIPAHWPNALDAANAALDEIDRLESQLTVYRESSEVSRLNALAATVPVPVEPGLFRLLQLAQRINEETEGAFDITAGALIKCWGFFKGPRRVPSEYELVAARERVGMSKVVLDEEGQRVRFLQPGLEINLGSIGKGYALDRVVEMLRTERRVPAALVHGGHSSVYAIGVPPHEARGWSVGLSDARNSTHRLGCIRLRDRALGTSAATFQHFEHQGRKLGHILDPRAGWPAEGMLSVSVAAPTAAEADALATAFFILGVDKARAYCESHKEIGAILVPREQGEGRVRPVAFGAVDFALYSRPRPVAEAVDFELAD